MTLNEFYAINVGDEVNLPFSICPLQIVVDYSVHDNTITTRPKNETGVSYVNHFECIEIVPKINKQYIEDKSQILKKFDDFIKGGCNNCPFHVECENVYNETRARSTNTMTICTALRKDKVNY